MRRATKNDFEGRKVTTEWIARRVLHSVRGAVCSNCSEEKPPSTGIAIRKAKLDILCGDPDTLSVQYAVNLTAQLVDKTASSSKDQFNNENIKSDSSKPSLKPKSPTRVELLDQYVKEVGEEYLAKIADSIPSVAVLDCSELKDLPDNHNKIDKNVDKKNRFSHGRFPRSSSNNLKY